MRSLSVLRGSVAIASPVRRASTLSGIDGPRSLPSRGRGATTVRRFMMSSTFFPWSFASTRACTWPLQSSAASVAEIYLDCEHHHPQLIVVISSSIIIIPVAYVIPRIDLPRGGGRRPGS
jgi:hypothetical protein